MTSDSDLSRIYQELLRRIQHIGIALQGQRREVIQVEEEYNLTKLDTPSIGEAEYAFMNWNCAILTAFRGSKTLTPKENLERNKKRNDELKKKMIEQNLKFRSVNGCYREANWEKANVEICFFVTNNDNNIGNTLSTEGIKDFFSKIFHLAEYYEQDSFLFTFPGVNRVAFLVATNDDGRMYFRDDIKFAGPLFTHVPDIGDWTDCSDGRISFRLKGMILQGGTGNKKIRIGEGDIFDVDAYKTDGIVIIHGKEQVDLKSNCHDYQGTVPLVERYFDKEDLTIENIHNKVLKSLKVLIDMKCKYIGFHCSASVNGSYVKGAACAYETIVSWAKRNDKKFKQIVIVDIYGDYAKVLNNKQK